MDIRERIRKRAVGKSIDESQDIRERIKSNAREEVNISKTTKREKEDTSQYSNQSIVERLKTKYNTESNVLPTARTNREKVQDYVKSRSNIQSKNIDGAYSNPKEFITRISKNPQKVTTIATDVLSSINASKINNKDMRATNQLLGLNAVQGAIENGIGVVSAVTTPIFEAEKKIGKVLNNEKMYNHGNTSQNYLKALQEVNDYGNKVTSKLESEGLKTASNVGRTLGNMAPSIALSVATGGVGTLATASKAGKLAKAGQYIAKNAGGILQATNVAGNETLRKLNEDNSNYGQAATTGTLKGLAEYGIEKLTGGNILAKGTSLDNIVSKGIANKFKTKVGQYLASKVYEFGGEVAEENITNAVGHAIDTVVNGEEFPGLKELWSEAGETTKMTLLTTLALNALGVGGGTYNEVKQLNLNKQQEAELNQITQATKDNIANNTQTMYNRANESESGINENSRGIESNDKRRVQELFETFERGQGNGSTGSQELRINQSQQSNTKSNIIEQKVKEYISNNVKDFQSDIKIDTKIINANNAHRINYKIQSQGVIYNKAKELFSNIHRRAFKNNNQSIYVTNADIKESIEKTLKEPNQRKYLNENIAVFSQLDKVIENAELISSESVDKKGRSQYQNYEYYVSKANIDGQPYIVEFDTRLQEGASGRKERHFRLERVYNINEITSQTSTDNSINQIGSDVISNNIIPQNTPNMQVPRETLPTARRKVLNPTEIANLKLEDANTTPKLKNRKYEKGNKQSNFYKNITETSQFLNEDLRNQMKDEENIKYYKGVTNEETLNKAYEDLQNGGQEETNKWFAKDDSAIDAEDVAKGWILLKQYQDKGDYESVVQVAKKMRNMGTKVGQAVQAYNIMSRLTPEGMFYYVQSELSEAYSKMIEGKSKKWIEENQSKFDLTPNETQFIMDTMNEVANMEDGYEKKAKIAEIQKVISDKIPATASQSVKAWMRISMLFNAKTQVRNVSGNAVIVPVNAVSDAISSRIDKAIAKKTGVRTTGTLNLDNYVDGLKKGLFESYNDFKKGINTRNIEGNRFEVSEGKNFNDKGIGKALNCVDNMLSFVLDAGDRGFYEATFTNSIRNQLILNNTTEVTADMIDIATKEALQRTWQDNNAYTNAVLKIRKILNFGKGYGLGDVLIPFAKTPANLTKAIIDYSPVGLTKTLVADVRKLKNSVENGQYTPQLQHQCVQNLGKGMAGSFLYVLGYALAKAGIASGEADEDKDVKNFMKNSLGISSYSIKIGDRTFSYDWAQPIATPLAIMTNYVKYSKDNPDANAIERIWKSMNIGTEQLLQQSFMESLNTVLNGSGSTLENLSQAVLELPARAIPTLSKQVADMVDGTQRTSFEYGKPIQSAANSVVAKIPFASKTLPTARDTLGNEIKKYGGENNVFNVMFNPANTNKGKLSKAGEEIYNVYMQTGDTTIFPRTAPYYINSKGNKITMTSAERSKFQEVSGKYVENTLNGLINNKEYQNLSNEKKASIINEIVSDSYSKAKYDVLKIDTEEYKKLRNTLKYVKAVTYYDYKFKTEDMKKDKEKLEIIVKANYTDKEKTALYENYIKSKEDDKYDIIKTTELNINSYLKYKLAESNEEFKSETKDDGTVKGKTVSGSAKAKKYSYISSMKGITYTQKLIMWALEYEPSTNAEKQKVLKYVTSLEGKTNEEKLDILSNFKGVKIYKDGRIEY